MPLKTLGPIGPRAVGERVKNGILMPAVLKTFLQKGLELNNRLIFIATRIRFSCLRISADKL